MASIINQATITESKSLKINKYLPISILYFFFNSFLLPNGLLYTALLTPFFLIWLYPYKAFSYIWIFFLVSIPYAIVHVVKGVELISYLKSYSLLFTVFVFGISFYQFLKLCNTLGALFKTLLLINFCFVFIALIILFIPKLQGILWHVSLITTGVEASKRLRLFTYEASYYSFLLVPIALYYYLKILLFRFPNKLLVFCLVTIPLLLSLSFGVTAGIVISLILLFCSDVKLITLDKKLSLYILITLILFCVFLFFALQFFPNNIVFIRIANIFEGRDTSFSGRTFDSLYLGWKLAEQKSILFGAGPGQIKVIGLDLFKEYYKYAFFTADQIAVPNSIGDMLAAFGVTGVIVKLGLEIYFFLKTQVYSNFYRLALFLFIFIYQFTGSFITNIAEYVIWIMAFCPFLFKEFDKKVFYKVA
jgi:hypothetical protein